MNISVIYVVGKSISLLFSFTFKRLKHYMMHYRDMKIFSE